MADTDTLTPLEQRKAELAGAAKPINDGIEIVTATKIEDDNNKPTPEAVPTGETANTGNKTAAENFAALRKKTEELEKQLAEFSPYKEKFESTSKELERFKPLESLVEKIQPDELVKSYQTAQERLEQLQEEAKNKDLQIQLADLKSSDWYKESVARPLQKVETQLRGILNNDEQLLRKVIDLSPGTDIPTPMEAVNIQRALKEADFDANPNWVVAALTEWKESAVKYQDVEANHTKYLEEHKEKQRQAELSRYQQEADMQKQLFQKMAVESSQRVQSTLSENLPGLFGEEDFKTVSASSKEYLEGAMNGGLNWGDANSVVMKASLFDQLMSDGSLKRVIDARKQEREGGGGTHTPTTSQSTGGETLAERKQRLIGINR